MKLKRAVITEELVTLTGGMMKGIILRQFIYWAVRTRDAKEYLEEIARKEQFNETESKPATEALENYEHGWIYKKADELKEEVMSDIGRKAIRKIINELRDKEWIKERKNPKYKWDQTLQYWVNLPKIEKDLQAIGYTLATVMGEDFLLVKDYLAMDTAPIGKDAGGHSRGQYAHSKGHNVHSKGHNVHSKGHSVHAIPETTTRDYSPKITTKDHAHSPDARASKEKISLKEQEAVNGSKDKVDSSKPRPKSHSRCQNQDLGKGKSYPEVDEKIIAFRRDLLEYATRSSVIRSPSGWVETILEEVRTYGDESLWFKEWLAGEPLGSHKMNEWEIAPDTVDPDFLNYLKRELKQPNDSEAQAVERTNQILKKPDHARSHWQTYQIKTSLHQKQEEEKAEKELAEMDQVYPEDAPVYFVKDLITGEMFDRDFNDPMGGRIFKAGILRAYSHADHQEKRDIMLILTNNNTTKEWARKTLED